jgi:hypothetical protein
VLARGLRLPVSADGLAVIEAIWKAATMHDKTTSRRARRTDTQNMTPLHKALLRRLSPRRSGLHRLTSAP